MTPSHFHLFIKGQPAVVLKTAGFKNKGQTFRRTLPEVVQLVHFRKSSSGGDDTFAASVGVASIKLLRAEGLDPEDYRDESRGHWSGRLTNAGARRDWWTITYPKEAAAAAEEVVIALRDNALPLFDVLSTDCGLCDAWSRKGGTPGPGTTEATALLQRAMLRRVIGPPEEATAAIEALKKFNDECRSGPFAPAVWCLRKVGAL